MTLRTRNRLYLIFFIISLVFTLCSIGLTVYLTATGGLHFIESEKIAAPSFFSSDGRFAVFSVMIFLSYVPTVAVFVCFGFEKTHSDEMIFFLIFLICTLAEGFRLFYPDQDIFILILKEMKTVYPVSGIPYTSSLLIRISKLIIFTRALAFLALLCIPFFPTIKKYLTVEELLLLVTGISILVSVQSRLKINDYRIIFIHRIVSRGALTWACLFVFVTTFILTGNYFIPRTKKRIMESIGYLEMISGYMVLGYSDSMFKMTVGSTLLIMGSFIYLRKIHTRLNS